MAMVLDVQFYNIVCYLVSSKFPWKLPSVEYHRTSLMISQLWFRSWLGAIRQQLVIAWTNVDQVLCHHIAWIGVSIIIPPAQRSCWGGILVSLRPSVRPSVPHAVSALYHLQLWMDSFHIRHKWSLPLEGVSRTMTFDLDLYLQGHLALT